MSTCCCQLSCWTPGSGDEALPALAVKLLVVVAEDSRSHRPLTVQRTAVPGVAEQGPRNSSAGGGRAEAQEGGGSQKGFEQTSSQNAFCSPRRTVLRKVRELFIS